MLAKLQSTVGDVRTGLSLCSRRAVGFWYLCLALCVLIWLLGLAAKNNTEALFDDATRVAAQQRVDLPARGQALLAENAVQGGPIPLVLLEEPQALDKNALKQISETALTLHSLLQQQTPMSANHAVHAGRVAGLAVAMRQDQLSNSNASFWQPISNAIAELEAAVRLGDIDAADSQALIVELRTRYAQLRSQGGTNESAAASAAAVTTTTSTTALNLDASVPWSLTALPWLLALLPLFCLGFAWVALSRMARRHFEDKPQAGYHQLVNEDVTQNMTTAALAVNRHAAERRTQAAILQLLDEMEPLGEGDLSYEASVTEDLTGALADAFNQAVYKLRRLVVQINRSSSEVRAAVALSRQRTLGMAKQGAKQAREVTRTYERLDRMQNEVASLSTTTSEVAERAQDVAARTDSAAVAVANSAASIQLMRQQANAAERCIQRLVASTQSIEARLADVQKAASRTELLALNSTIEAASRQTVTDGAAYAVTEQDKLHPSAKRYAELSTDVSALSAMLGSASRDIGQLVDIIRDEVKDSVGAMQATLHQADLTEIQSVQAADHLQQIAKATDALQQAAAEIAQRMAVQAQGLSEVAEATGSINEITHSNATALSQAVSDLQKLENLSNSLDASVHGFRLPVEDTP